MLLKLIILVVGLHQIQANCKRLLGELGDAEKEFDVCIIHNAVPITMCIKCAEQYKDMSDSFEILRSNCSEYFDQDRVNVVATSMDALKSVWTKAYCSECDAQKVETFNNMSLKLNNCIGNHKKEPCNACMEAYVELNSFYRSLDERNDGKVCFDLQDAMNRTRYSWSKEHNCCHRESRMILFIATLCLVTGLTFTFYGATYAVTKYQERNHEILNDADSSNFNSRRSTWNVESSQPSVAAPSLNIRQEALSTSANVPVATKRSQINDSSSDDDCDISYTKAK